MTLTGGELVAAGPWGEGGGVEFPVFSPRSPAGITYRVSLDVERTTVVFVARLLAAERRARGTRRRRRSLTPWGQAVLVAPWFRDSGVRVAALARDTGIAPATAYRYLHEGIDVLAAKAPDLHEELAAAKNAGAQIVLLDGTLIETDRVTDGRDSAGRRVKDRWYSGKHKHHGGNVQVIADSAGRPLWTSPVEPGSTHDLAAARAHVLPALYAAARSVERGGLGLSTLADKGYTWTGSGIRTPYLRPSRHLRGTGLHPATAGWNAYVNATRAAVERAIAHLKTRWATLRHVTLNPNRIGAITAAALVLHRHENSY